MNDQLHYVTYDPEAMWSEMMAAYADAGGDVLYGGDEKEMLLRAVLAISAQILAGVDVALLMATVRYAQGDYLKLLGDERGCPYNDAIAAEGAVWVSLKADGVKKTIPAGTVMTPDGAKYYQTLSPIQHTGEEDVHSVAIRCTEPGVGGNGVSLGTTMKLVNANPSVDEIVVIIATAGGVAAEDMEAYRERARTSGMRASTTGPVSQYEAVALGASAAVIDVQAVNGGAGIVDVNLLLSDGADAEDAIAAVNAALSDETVRPLTDTVNVRLASAVEYNIVVAYAIASPLKAEDGARALRAAADEYLAWQDNAIGRAFDPFRLIGMLYQAGASRVEFKPESTFDGGPLQYTEIDAYTHTKGTITLEAMS